MTSLSGVTPASLYILRSSDAERSVPSSARLRFHSTCTAPGMAPPRAARAMRPVYSSSLRVSRITASGEASRSATSCRLAARYSTGLTGHCTGFGTRASRLTGSLASSHAEKPPSSTHASGCPKYSRNQNTRAARIPVVSSYTTTERSALMPRCSSTWWIIHRNARRGASSVSIRLKPQRSRWIAPGMCPAAKASAGRVSTMMGGEEKRFPEGASLAHSPANSAGKKAARACASSRGSMSRSGRSNPIESIDEAYRALALKFADVGENRVTCGADERRSKIGIDGSHERVECPGPCLEGAPYLPVALATVRDVLIDQRHRLLDHRTVPWIDPPRAKRPEVRERREIVAQTPSTRCGNHHSSARHQQVPGEAGPARLVPEAGVVGRMSGRRHNLQVVITGGDRLPCALESDNRIERRPARRQCGQARRVIGMAVRDEHTCKRSPRERVFNRRDVRHLAHARVDQQRLASVDEPGVVARRPCVRPRVPRRNARDAQRAHDPKKYFTRT